MVTPILTTKLHIPSLRRNLVPRQRLLDRLDRGLRRKLTLVSAPAGFGKTTVLAEWIQSLQARRSPPITVAWISLDEGDNDPARFSAYLEIFGAPPVVRTEPNPAGVVHPTGEATSPMPG